MNHGQNWKGWERSGEKGLIISDNQVQTCLIITINDTSTGDLPLIITISDSSKNQPKRLDSDNQINLSRLIVNLGHQSCLSGEEKRDNKNELGWRTSWTCDELNVPCVLLDWHGELVLFLVDQWRACQNRIRQQEIWAIM